MRRFTEFFDGAQSWSRVERIIARVEAEVEAEWTAHLGEEATAQLRAALERLREVTDPYR